MKFLVIIAAAISFAACNSNNNNPTDEAAENPAEMHPPAETVPDSLSILNDSAIMADTSRTNKSTGDTVRGNP